jgi:hypothetical protein
MELEVRFGVLTLLCDTSRLLRTAEKAIRSPLVLIICPSLGIGLNSLPTTYSIQASLLGVLSDSATNTICSHRSAPNLFFPKNHSTQLILYSPPLVGEDSIWTGAECCLLN